MSAHPSRPSQNTRRMLGTVMTVIVIALVCIVTSAAFAANPVEEMAKQKIGGGIDPHIDSVAIHAAQPRSVFASGIHITAFSQFGFGSRLCMGGRVASAVIAPRVAF